MSKRIALLFSGQGAQRVGMGKDLAAHYPDVADLFKKADTILERPLSQIAFDGPEEELTKTINCQPALYVHGMACLMALKHEWGDFPVAATAGLSLGEFTAHAAAGTFPFETGLSLVAQRAQFMQEACDSTEGTMAAMIGSDENDVRNLAAEADVDIANLNSPGQVVISGETTKVSFAASMAKEYGIPKAILLNVAGAYHSRLMNSAYLQLGEVLHRTIIQHPEFDVLCNVDAIAVRDPAVIRKALQDQVTGTVRWADTMARLVDEYRIEQFIELGPGGVLAGLLNRTRKGTPIVSISDLNSLREALAILRE